MSKKVVLQDLGSGRAYQQVWSYQEELLLKNTALKATARENAAIAAKNKAGVEDLPSDEAGCENYLLFVEHNPVYTLGKSGDICHVLIDEEQRRSKGIEFYKINRGGDITFHGPGQLVGYPILDLEQFKTDLGWYLRSLEEVIIKTMAEYGLKGERSAGETGVWLDAEVKGRERKICAMGIRCSRWITMHGFAFNVNTDLNYFNYIIPCGIQNKQVTSLQHELGHVVNLNEVKLKVMQNFEKVFAVELQHQQADIFQGEPRSL